MHWSTVRYHQLRAELFLRLGGGRCAKFGEPDIHGNFIQCHSELHVDHEDGREYEVRELGGVQRIKRYMAELDQGVKLRLLCKTHNGCDGYKKGEARTRARKDRRAKKG